MRRILIGERYIPKLKNGLLRSGFSPIGIPDNPSVDDRLAGHADLSIFKVNDHQQIVAEFLIANELFVNQLTNDYEIIPAKRKQSAKYPNDATLCGCIVGDWIIHNCDITDPEIIRCCRKKFLNVRQGYANCMICEVNEQTIISSDAGIAKAAEAAGLEVLIISPGSITLEGFDTGFIGGASFTYRDTVFFTGSIIKHPDYERIINLISSKGKKAVYLSTEPVFDIGGAVIL